MNQDLLVSRTQPAIGHAYDAVSQTGEYLRNCKVVYQGYQDGKHLVVSTDGKTHPAERTSGDDEEPTFHFDSNAVIR